MASIVELPSLIKLDMEEPSFRKAVQQNFDHLAMALKVSLGAAEEAHEEAAFVKGEVNKIDPAEGIGDVQTQLAEAGVGAEDGAPPPQVTNVRAVGGIGNWFMVIWDGVANTSGVTYEVHVHTTSGFTPSASTKVGTFEAPGGTDKMGTFLVRDFPSGHALDGTGSDPVNTSTTYYIKIVPVDGSGPGPASTQVSSTALVVDASTVIAAGTVIGNLIAGDTIVGGHIVGGSITADKLNVGELSAITANVGTLTGGLIHGVTLRSSTGSSYAELSASYGAALALIFNGSLVGRVFGANGALGLASANGVTRIHITDGVVEIPNNTQLSISDPLKYSDGNDTLSNPGVSAGAGQALPGAPAVWFKIITPANGTRWFPTW